MIYLPIHFFAKFITTSRHCQCQRDQHWMLETRKVQHFISAHHWTWNISTMARAQIWTANDRDHKGTSFGQIQWSRPQNGTSLAVLRWSRPTRVHHPKDSFPPVIETTMVHHTAGRHDRDQKWYIILIFQAEDQSHYGSSPDFPTLYDRDLRVHHKDVTETWRVHSAQRWPVMTTLWAHHNNI